MCQNLSLQLATHKIKWEGAILMNEYYVVLAITILCPSFAVIINIISKDDKSHHVTIGNIPQCTCPNFTKMSSHILRKKGKWVYWKHLHNVFKIFRKVDYNNSAFTFWHIPTMRSCNHMSLPVLLNTSSDASAEFVTCQYMMSNVCHLLWLCAEMFWIPIICT